MLGDILLQLADTRQEGVLARINDVLLTGELAREASVMLGALLQVH